MAETQKAAPEKASFWFIGPHAEPTLVRRSEGGSTELRPKGVYCAAARQVLDTDNTITLAEFNNGAPGEPRSLGRKVSVETPARLVDAREDTWEGADECLAALQVKCAETAGTTKAVFVGTGYVAGKL